MEEDVEYVIPNLPSYGQQGPWEQSGTMAQGAEDDPVKLINYNADEDISSLILFEEFDRSWKPEENFFDL